MVKVKCKIKLLVISEGAAKMVNMSAGQAGVTVGETAGEAGVTAVNAVAAGVTAAADGVSFSPCQWNISD